MWRNDGSMRRCRRVWAHGLCQPLTAVCSSFCPHRQGAPFLWLLWRRPLDASVLKPPALSVTVRQVVPWHAPCGRAELAGGSLVPGRRLMKILYIDLLGWCPWLPGTNVVRSDKSNQPRLKTDQTLFTVLMIDVDAASVTDRSGVFSPRHGEESSSCTAPAGVTWKVYMINPPSLSYSWSGKTLSPGLWHSCAALMVALPRGWTFTLLQNRAVHCALQQTLAVILTFWIKSYLSGPNKRKLSCKSVTRGCFPPLSVPPCLLSSSSVQSCFLLFAVSYLCPESTLLVVVWYLSVFISASLPFSWISSTFHLPLLFSLQLSLGRRHISLSLSFFFLYE